MKLSSTRYFYIEYMYMYIYIYGKTSIILHNVCISRGNRYFLSFCLHRASLIGCIVTSINNVFWFIQTMEFARPTDRLKLKGCIVAHRRVKIFTISIFGQPTTSNFHSTNIHRNIDLIIYQTLITFLVHFSNVYTSTVICIEKRRGLVNFSQPRLVAIFTNSID